jgi:Molybdopterin oxidoreductase Fe4S4 domain
MTIPLIIQETTKGEAICPYCGVGCRLLMESADGKLIRAKGVVPRGDRRDHRARWGRGRAWGICAAECPRQLETVDPELRRRLPGVCAARNVGRGRAVLRRQNMGGHVSSVKGEVVAGRRPDASERLGRKIAYVLDEDVTIYNGERVKWAIRLT